MMRSSYNAANADIKVKINGVWQPASPLLRDIYIGYKSLPMSNGSAPYFKDGITIFRTDNDVYMPTFYSVQTTNVTNARNVIRENDYIFPENESHGIQEGSSTPIPIIDFNDIYIFLVDGVTGPGSRNGAGWVKARNYQTWAYVNFIYDDTRVRKCYASQYSTYLAFPAGFDTPNIVTIGVPGLAPNIIFSISRNDNNSVYYEKNDASHTRVRICDNEYARAGFLGFYTRITMDVGMIITPPPPLAAAAAAASHSHTISSPGSALVLACIGDKPPMVDLTDNEEHQCIMCYENKKNVQFYPCNHAISCYRCMQQMTKCECPVCKSAIHTFQYFKQ